ncbi:MAG TPA: von Willebrand factor type A domain-containing protein [Gemmatimonadaceae bacterium]|nr:von Willebrand factor type A domain-containing protein [Gemmatimonadaceae bacterium]
MLSPILRRQLRRATVALALVPLPLLAARAPAAPFLTATTVVTGRVTDGHGNPVPQAQLRVADRGGAATAAVDGRYWMQVPRMTAPSRPERVVIRVARIGFQPRDVPVVLRGDTVHADIQLTAASVRLESAVVSSAPSADAATSAIPAPATAPVGIATGKTFQRGVAGGVAMAAPGIAQRRATAPYPGYPHPRHPRAWPDSANTEAYDQISENPFRSPRVAPLSTFSVDVDRASYTNVRRFLTRGSLPPRDAVRIEELVNYFPYDDPAPVGDVPLRITTELAPAPWNPRHDLVRVALRARDVDMRRAPASNLVFLVDVSGSMYGPGRLPLVKQSLALLVNELREDDHVAIVVYAGQAGLVLPSTPGSDKQRILQALDGLEAGGSTAGGAGIRLAYDVARRSFIRGGNNRVILCTDGDFNVGQSSDAELVRLIEDRRREGSFLTILGFGMGNYKDAKMEKLAGAGNGNYGYIDDLLEARKMLVREMGGTLLTVAKDVKLQVEFDPTRVQAYRLLGYEDRLLRDEDFANDAKDAGDVGAGHTVTALYEIVRAGVPLDVTLPDVAPLRYQQPSESRSRGDELLTVAMRYKQPDGERSMLVTQPVRASSARRASESMRFASAVAGFGMLLRHSPNSGSLTWDDVLSLARGARGADEDGYRADFIRLAEIARSLDRQVARVMPVDDPQ